MRLRIILGSAVLGGALLLGGAVSAQADDRCSERDRREWRRLERDFERRGLRSRPARRLRSWIREISDPWRVERRQRCDGDDDRRWDRRHRRHRDCEDDDRGEQRFRRWHHRDEDDEDDDD